MNKILLVIRREYMTRVRKPSFWLLTLLVPIMLAALYAIPIYLAMKPLEKSVVLVADESGVFGGLDRDDTLRSDSHFASTDNVTYRYAATLDYAKRLMDNDKDVTAILYCATMWTDSCNAFCATDCFRLTASATTSTPSSAIPKSICEPKTSRPVARLSSMSKPGWDSYFRCLSTW